ncbi:sporulation integral membrane protein YlbJ [Paenibacillus radicis (ex Gao et al. 2016)]|uniref:Sporulation integral membrane protein YlbJ n=1 Tax=Paenibacillus radicis (ex Gao et al. 2016) TaxID=1737354 RepID=A0A917M4F8_9BACL|nr:sporulation integral membrane protein YlbJ [Paenibacillus radicis (ex Gao et al. 2016)]GGG76330.1 sporulation integral membrane protein YlbJ [Paenibacillus radicis (ex Gao et al. 2016)]
MLRTLAHPASLAGLGALLIVMLMACFPSQTLESSLRGVMIWWQVLFPALFPFLVISELMLGFGIVHFFGKLLDPLMRPLFRLPGIGSFVVAMGYVSGYPVGAKLTVQLWEQRLVNRAEGERLVAFTTTSDPVFLIGAVSLGFFHNAALAPILATAHYVGALIIGLLMRFHDRKAPMSGPHRRPTNNQGKRRESRIASALKAMHEARLLDGRSLGKLLQDSIQSALRLMIVIGGLVVFFSVVIEMLTRTGVAEAMSELLRILFQWFGLPLQLADAVIYGLFEVTLGAKAAGSSGTLLMHQVAIAAWVLSWGGLSVHAQVVSLLSRTDMRYAPLLVSRMLHGFISIALVYLLWGWLAP